MLKTTKAILTGGGRATRLRPVTNTMNKHLIPLANQPMIFYAIERAVDAGIEEIFINLNPDETRLPEFVGDGGHWGVKITYYVQTGGPQGVAHIAKCAEKFIGDDPFLFYLSDNIVVDSLKPFFNNFWAERNDCRLLLTRVPDPERSGVARFDERGKLVEIIEKPPQPPTNLIMTGIMLYGPKVFFEAYQHLAKSARGEYEISGINTYLLENGYCVGHQEIGWWKDTGLPKDLLVANQALLGRKIPAEFKREGTVAPGAFLTGAVQMGAGTTVSDSVTIEGPVIIGENCTLDRCRLGPDVTMGSGCTVREATVSNSIVLNNTTITAPVTIADSIIGERSRLKARKTEACRLLAGDYTVLEL